MKKSKYIILSIILIIFLLNIDLVIKAVYDSSLLFFNKVFVSVFPFIILCDILLYYDYHIFLENIFGKIISKLFNINKSCTIVFILSLLTCAPSNAVYIKDLIDKKEISIKDGENILIFTSFSSISFVIGTIGVYLYKSIFIGIMLWFIVLINNIIIGLYLRNNNHIIDTTKLNNNIKKQKNIFILLKDSTLKAINTSFIILGNIIIFTIVINIFLKYFSFNQIISSIIVGFLEMTNGIIMISNLNINIISKLFLTSFVLTFSSISILFQLFSILSDYKINIKKILIIKLVFSSFWLMLFILSIIFL